MSLLRDDVRFPYCDLNVVYLKCGKNQRLKQIFHHLLLHIYTECMESVWPILSDEPTNRYFTYAVDVLTARSFYDNFATNEVYPWHVNPIAIQVPYGNIWEFDSVSTDWRVWCARTMRSIWHGARLLPNDQPFNKKFVNIAIPWIPLDKDPYKLTDLELFDYAEIILSAVSAQIWVMNKRVISMQAHPACH